MPPLAVVHHAVTRNKALKKGDRGIILGEERGGFFLIYFDGIIYQNPDGIFL